MSESLFLVPISLAFGVIGLVAFFWSLSTSQYDDLDGTAERILYDEDYPLRKLPDEVNGEDKLQAN